MVASLKTVAAEKEAAGKAADVPAPAKLTLAQRMAAIRADAFGVGKSDIDMEYEDKTGVRRKYTIKGHTVDAVLSEMRPLLVKHGVGLTPLLRERTYNGNRCDVLIDFEFQNLDNEAETKVIPWAGAGTDKGDKGFSKAGTNALKEMLKKVFLVTDRDDAREEEEKVEHETEEGLSRSQVDKVTEKAREATEKWATTFRLAVMKATNEKEVNRLYRESASQLQELPDVTRTFFADLKASRLAYFAPPTPDEAARAEQTGEDEE